MDVQKLSVHIIFSGGQDVTFVADTASVSSDNESYVFKSYPGSNNFTILEPIRKSDIAFLSMESKTVSVPDPEPPVAQDTSLNQWVSTKELEQDEE